MRTRQKGLQYYGISKERNKELLELARQEQNRNLLLQAAEASNPDIAHYLVMGLYHGMSYSKIYKWEPVPLPEKDFYGYRRKALAIFNHLLLDKKK